MSNDYLKEMSKEEYMEFQDSLDSVMDCFLNPTKLLWSKKDFIEHIAETAVLLHELEGEKNESI